MGRQISVAGKFAILFIASGVLALSGCMDVRDYITIHLDGKCTERMDLTFPATTGDAVSEKMNEQKRRGYSVETRTDGDRRIFSFSRDFESVESMLNNKRDDPTMGDGGRIEGGLRITNLFFVKMYRFDQVYLPPPESKDSQGTRQESDIEATGEQMMRSMFSLKQIVEMPGTIVSSNAASVQGSTATWDLPVDYTTRGFEMHCTSRLVNTTAVIGAGVMGGIIALLVALASVFMMVKVALTRDRSDRR